MDIQSTLKILPESPGVYIYRDANDAVIYVGKARILKNRVRSYFHTNQQNEKTRQLVAQIRDIQYIVTENEMEALLLENNLIKQYKPKYNILLKDDKGYPYLKLDIQSDFPSLSLARKMEFDKALYFGPYHGATSAKAIAELATEMYPLKTCKGSLSKIKRPCLKYQIGQCPAPCVFPDKREYAKNVQGVIDFLKGDRKEALNALRKKMLDASARQEYELAAKYRDKLMHASELLSKQKIVLEIDSDIDVIASCLNNGYAVICTMFVRSGRITGVVFDEQENVDYESENELISKFIIQHYSSVIPPKEIVCYTVPDDLELLTEILSKLHKCNIHVPMRGKKAELCSMARKNAIERMQKSNKHLSYKDKRIKDGMLELKEVLNLHAVPKRMECFDISHIQGTDTVASMTVFTDGKADNKEYRHFKIQHPGNDDFLSMYEVLSRRYSDFLEQKRGFEKAPDLVVIDGGKGQLSSAQSVFKKLGLNFPMISLAEREEEIFLPGISDPIVLPRSSPALQIVQSIRDEAHRFAITFHRSLRGKRSILSVLDEIEGIGKKRKKALMLSFRSVEKIKNASLEEILAVDGMNKPSAEAVYNYFNK